jgi:hypothetical protein
VTATAYVPPGVVQFVAHSGHLEAVDHLQHGHKSLTEFITLNPKVHSCVHRIRHWTVSWPINPVHTLSCYLFNSESDSGSLYVPPVITLSNFDFRPQKCSVRFIWFSE